MTNPRGSPGDSVVIYWPNYLRVTNKEAAVEKRVGKRALESLANLAGLRLWRDEGGAWHTVVPGCIASVDMPDGAHETFATAREAAAFFRGFVRATQMISRAEQIKAQTPRSNG